jgi:hypothetical protein
MHKSEEKTAEQCLVCPEKKKWSVVKVFGACFRVVRFLVNLFSLIDKYGPKILSFLGIDTE